MLIERASTYDGSTMHRWVASRPVAVLGDIGDEATVLDAAAGTGLASRAVLARFQRLASSLLISPAACERLRP
ncbi:MAG: hypothetical protein H0T91_04945 [Propionibacteriaceae bacterium]|nr:hypothetical protein [Propionibacteriaceae bacterium]